VIAFAVLVSILIWPGGTSQAVAVLKTASWPLFAVIGVLGAGLSFILYIIGLNHTTPVMASVMAMIEPLAASLFGVVVLNESLVGIQILGMLLILFTVTALSANTFRRPL
jgi:drug/metabolite transporter (DMT)-like permease